LNKSDKLTAAEEAELEKHPQSGADFVSRIPQLASCASGILHHHEWYNGSGYPDGLKGEDIPLESRIISIADAFIDMTSERPPSGGKTVEEALEVLKQYSGKRFDPALVEQFISIYMVSVNSVKKEKK
jgi:HD-GYP domain-containing protein (c-di-GMP phosphodiesterase class II)